MNRIKSTDSINSGYDVVIIGSGPAGLSAGIYASRAGLKTIIVEKGLAGGLSLEAPLIENYLGIEQIEGNKLAEKFKSHALNYVEIREMEEAKQVIKGNKKYVVKTINGKYVTQAVIFATGTTHKRLNVKGEKNFLGKGVSYCVTCDGFFFKNKKVAVIGGGNSGAIAAIYLNNICKEVTVVEFMPRVMCEAAYWKKINELGINYLTNHQVTEIYGGNSVKGLKIKNKENNQSFNLEVDGVFIYVGLKPQSKLAKQIGVKINDKGYIYTDENQRTNLPRIYAAGDVTGKTAQIIVAAAQGAVAALSAYEDLKLK